MLLSHFQCYHNPQIKKFLQRLWWETNVHVTLDVNVTYIHSVPLYLKWQICLTISIDLLTLFLTLDITEVLPIVFL